MSEWRSLDGKDGGPLPDALAVVLPEEWTKITTEFMHEVVAPVKYEVGMHNAIELSRVFEKYAEIEVRA